MLNIPFHGSMPFCFATPLELISSEGDEYGYHSSHLPNVASSVGIRTSDGAKIAVSILRFAVSNAIC